MHLCSYLPMAVEDDTLLGVQLGQAQAVNTGVHPLLRKTLTSCRTEMRPIDQAMEVAS